MNATGLLLPGPVDVVGVAWGIGLVVIPVPAGAVPMGFEGAPGVLDLKGAVPTDVDAGLELELDRLPDPEGAVPTGVDAALELELELDRVIDPEGAGPTDVDAGLELVFD